MSCFPFARERANRCSPTCLQYLTPQTFSSAAFVEGVDKLDLATRSPAVKTIVDAARIWHDFA